MYVLRDGLAKRHSSNGMVECVEPIIENGDLMADANRKPWLTASQQIDHLKSRGVHFSLMSEDEARVYLEKNNNYFRLRAYRLGFPKVEEGARKGEYANLNFKMLLDLSIVDMLLRYEMLPLTLDERKKMSNDRVQQIVTTLYAHKELASKGVFEHRARSLALFVERMNEHIDYYRGNPQVLTGFEFLTKVTDAWFPFDTY